jgi:hypothetical protein
MEQAYNTFREKNFSYINIVGNTQRKAAHGRRKCKWKDGIKMHSTVDFYGLDCNENT